MKVIEASAGCSALSGVVPIDEIGLVNIKGGDERCPIFIVCNNAPLKRNNKCKGGYVIYCMTLHYCGGTFKWPGGTDPIF